jgi:hypothetical protein
MKEELRPAVEGNQERSLFKLREFDARMALHLQRIFLEKPQAQRQAELQAFLPFLLTALGMNETAYIIGDLLEGN